MAKQIAFNEEARRGLERGMNIPNKGSRFGVSTLGVRVIKRPA